MLRFLPFTLIMLLVLPVYAAAQTTQLPPPVRPASPQNMATQNPLVPASSSTAGLDGDGGFSADDIPRDNISGAYILQEVGHIRPVASTNGIVYAVNQEGGQLVAFGTSPFQKLVEIPIGLGGNSVYEHPNRPFEIWITDSISNCVTVIDPTTLTVGHTIRTNGSPHGLAFSADGSRAYVTCSSARTVDVIDTNTFALVNTIPIEARRPRGIARVGDNVFVAPLLSGNNTTALSANGANSSFVLSLPPLAPQGVNPLHDIDLRTIGVSPTGASFEEVNASLSWTEIGTVIFNVQNRPGTNEIWVCNTDALNAEILGEQNFIDGQVVRNRVTIIDTEDGPGSTVTHIDLDAVSAGAGCAQPRGVTFDPQRGRVYVSCEGSDRIAVLSNAGAWLGSYKLQGLDNGRIRCMPQGATLVGDVLYVYNKGTNSLSVIDLTTTPLDTTVNNHMSLGYTPLTDDIRRGRSIIHDADLSESGASSCASCHIDGDLDGVVWDLSGVLDPQGTPNNQLTFWFDRKGPMVTQSLNGLPEGAPYHWRGERADLEAFNGAFEELLDGSPLPPASLADMVAYINELHYPANHVQQDDREPTAEELEGARIFIEELSLPSATCNDCHTMPTGSNNEPMRLFAGGFAPSVEVAQLRNVGDKELGKHDLGDLSGLDLGNSSEIGPSLIHDGRLATLFDFSNAFVNIDPLEAEMLEHLMRAWDTGLAPATTIQATMTQANALNFPELALLLSEADQGDCDLVASGSVSANGAAPLRVSAWYNPATQLFEFESRSYGQVPASFLALFVNAGYGSWTFRGVPVASGRRIIDTDMDGLGNIDETQAYGTQSDNPDTDNDGYPDGYEVTWNMNPLVPNLSAPDAQAPGIISAGPVFQTTNMVKIDVETDELCVVTATWNGLRGPETRVSPRFAPYAFRHQFVVNFLPENAPTQVTLTATDPNGNMSTMQVFVQTDPERVPDIHIDNMAQSVGPIAVSPGSGQATANLSAGVQVLDHLGAPAAGYEVRAFVYLEPAPGQLVLVASTVTAVTDNAGKANFTVPLSWNASLGSSGQRTVHFGVFDIRPTQGSGLINAYTEANDVVNFISLSF